MSQPGKGTCDRCRAKVPGPRQHFCAACRAIRRREHYDRAMKLAGHVRGARCSYCGRKGHLRASCPVLGSRARAKKLAAIERRLRKLAAIGRRSSPPSGGLLLFGYARR